VHQYQHNSNHNSSSSPVTGRQSNVEQPHQLGPIDPILAMAGPSGFQLPPAVPSSTSANSQLSRLPSSAAEVGTLQRVIYGTSQHQGAGPNNFSPMMTSPSQAAECAAGEESDVFDVEFPAYDGVDGIMKISFQCRPPVSFFVLI
jgi:hypothetical protein